LIDAGNLASKFASESLSELIPTALIIDCCLCSGGDERDALWIFFKKVPGVADFVDDVVVVVEDGDGEFVAARYSQTFSMGLSSGA
jgi:hypothetical protein